MNFFNTVVGLSFLHLVHFVIAQSDNVTCSGSLIRPKPPKINCGSEGTLPSSAQPVTVVTGISELTQCRDVCFKLPGGPGVNGRDSCVSFQWDSNTGECSIYQRLLYQMGYTLTPKQTGVFHYNRRCFDVSCYCSGGSKPVEDREGNILGDPSFEYPYQTEISFNRAFYDRSCTPGRGAYDGRGFLALSGPAPGEYFDYPGIAQGLDQPIGRHTTQIRYRIVSGPSNCSIKLLEYFFSTIDNELLRTVGKFPDASQLPTPWRSFTVRTDDRPRQNMIIYIYCPGDPDNVQVDFDQITIVPEAPYNGTIKPARSAWYFSSDS